VGADGGSRPPRPDQKDPKERANSIVESENTANSRKNEKLRFAGTCLAHHPSIVQDAARQTDNVNEGEGSGEMAKRQTAIRCEDCFFHQQMLCALSSQKPCPTFRPAERGLKPERQLSFVFRTGRQRAAYAFQAPS